MAQIYKFLMEITLLRFLKILWETVFDIVTSSGKTRVVTNKPIIRGQLIGLIVFVLRKNNAAMNNGVSFLHCGMKSPDIFAISPDLV